MCAQAPHMINGEQQPHVLDLSHNQLTGDHHRIHTAQSHRARPPIAHHAHADSMMKVLMQIAEHTQALYLSSSAEIRLQRL